VTSRRLRVFFLFSRYYYNDIVRKNEWAEHVACMRSMTNWIVLFVKPQDKWLFRSRITVGVRVESKLTSGKKWWRVWMGYTEQLWLWRKSNCGLRKTAYSFTCWTCVCISTAFCFFDVNIRCDGTSVHEDAETRPIQNLWSCVIRGHPPPYGRAPCPVWPTQFATWVHLYRSHAVWNIGLRAKLEVQRKLFYCLRAECICKVLFFINGNQIR